MEIKSKYTRQAARNPRKVIGQRCIFQDRSGAVQTGLIVGTMENGAKLLVSMVFSIPSNKARLVLKGPQRNV